MAKMFLCTSQRSKRAASRACKRVRRCNSTSPRDRRAGRLKTSRLCKPVISAKGDFHGDRLFHLKSELRKDERGNSPAILRISYQANGVSLTRDENNTSYVVIRHNVRTYQSAGVVEVIKGRHNAETAVKKL